jgi:hypothetical protein
MKKTLTAFSVAVALSLSGFNVITTAAPYGCGKYGAATYDVGSNGTCPIASPASSSSSSGGSTANTSKPAKRSSSSGSLKTTSGNAATPSSPEKPVTAPTPSVFDPTADTSVPKTSATTMPQQQKFFSTIFGRILLGLMGLFLIVGAVFLVLWNHRHAANQPPKPNAPGPNGPIYYR